MTEIGAIIPNLLRQMKILGTIKATVVPRYSVAQFLACHTTSAKIPLMATYFDLGT